ncbi:MAG TPA: alpha/beta fold hydrolase [Candidatus Dormibacteraeota bacterium]|nr:alpha/beta fold hydrolase [Candidatus Dormibacteraeota bacterium]
MPGWRRAVMLVLAAAVAGTLGTAYWAAGQWVAADHRRVGPPPADLPAQPVEFGTPAGDTLRGWFVPGRPGGGAVVLMHGSHETRRAMIGQARFLHQHGYAVLLFDFHAYGESHGEQTTFGYGESADAAAAVALLRTLAPGERIAAVGFSLGGAAALLGPRPLVVDAMVIEAVYPDIRDAVANRLRLRFGALGPWLAPLLTAQVEPRFGVGLDQLRPIDAIARVHVPVFLIAGTEDERATLADSRRLFAAANEPKQFWAVPGAAHVNFQHFAPDEYEARLLAFLDHTLRGEPAPGGP